MLPEIISDYDVKKWFEFFGNRDFTIQPDKIIAQAEIYKTYQSPLDMLIRGFSRALYSRMN
ncbi:TPA: hypothetical protein U1348_000669 [Streptococcus suis]|nr:hypothetical protein [Streptococcus suis]